MACLGSPTRAGQARAKKEARGRFRADGPKKPAITYSRPIRTTIGRVGLTTEFGMGSGVSPRVWSPATRVRRSGAELAAGDCTQVNSGCVG
jgi:hypothetical protein